MREQKHCHFIVRNNPQIHIVLSYFIDCFKNIPEFRVSCWNCFFYLKARSKVSADLFVCDDPIAFFIVRIFNWNANILFLSFEMFEFQLKSNSFKKVLRNLLFRIAHFIALRSCNLVVFPSELRRDFYVNKYPWLTAKSVVVENKPLDKNLVNIDEKIHTEVSMFVKSFKRTIVYAGMIHSTALFSSILEQVSKSSELGMICLLPRYYSELEGKLKSKNIKVFYRVPHEVVQGVYSFCDVGLLLYENSPMNVKYCAPVKLFEYAKAGILIVSNDNFAMSRNRYVDKVFKSPEELCDFCSSVEIGKRWSSEVLDFRADFNSILLPKLRVLT